MEEIRVIKRDGKEALFNINKIKKAINNTLFDLKIEIPKEKMENLSESIEDQINQSVNEENKIAVEKIQDIIIQELEKNKYKNVARRYSSYRKERDRVRGIKSDLIKTISKIGVETDRDNANVGNNFSSKLLRIASESNKWSNLALMPKKLSRLHEVGDLYFHDLDSYNLTINCLHIPTRKVLVEGFNTGYGTINKPKRIESAAELSCILLQATQNDMFGGQSHPNFDNDMSIFIEPTRQEIKRELEELGIEDEKIEDLVRTRLIKRVHQAMQGVIYNLNTMHSRAGSQVPFSSVNIGIPESEDAALVCEAFLEEYEKGLGIGEQPIFPNIIFRVKEGINKNPEDKYYYLYKLACRVTAKRMNPTFMNLDADFNKEYYDKGYIPATMGCVDGKEVVTYKIDDLLYVESFERMWEKLSLYYEVKTQEDGVSKYIDLSNDDLVKIFDSKNGFVKVKKIIKNKDNSNWVQLTFSNGRILLATMDHPLPIVNKGRTLISDINLKDEIFLNNIQYSEDSYRISEDKAWFYGYLLPQNFKKIKFRNKEQRDKLISVFKSLDIKDISFNDKEFFINDKYSQSFAFLDFFYGGSKKKERHIPSVIFSWSRNLRKTFIDGILDSNGERTENKNIIYTKNKEFALQLVLLVQSLGLYCKVFIKNSFYRVEFKNENKNISYNKAFVEKIEFLGNINNYSYDVETESDYFDVSGIYSHNCRTYIMKNINGESGCEGRGNIAPVTINLPRIGIQSEGDVKKFFNIFDKRLLLAKKSLLHRYDILKKLKVKDLPFVAGQNLMKGSENLNSNDSIEPILKQGTWGIGFIGLAETLTALVGSHHGETEEAKELGFKIIKHLRDFCDKATEETHLNWSAYATPAEGLSGKFIKQDQKLFGKIKGVTDKDYYTNSFHIPVKYPISIKDKIDIEAPYHKLCNGGHISYVEVDNYPTAELIMKILDYAYTKTNINYIGINFHIKYCKECGTYIDSQENKCPKCGSLEIQGISRVTGYLSLDERFGEGKLKERKDRISHSNGKNNY